MSVVEYENDLVVKSNVLIEAMTNMSLQQQRFLAFVSASLPVMTEMKDVEMELNVADFASHFNVDFKNAYKVIEEKATQLQHKIIEFKDGKYRIKVGILLKAKYKDDEGRVWVKVDEDIVPHLINLKQQFTSYRIKDVYQFKSAKTWRVYELLAQYKSIGKREIHLDDLRFSLNIENKYEHTHNVERYILKPAITEINKVSDLHVAYEKIKRGRKVVGYRFHITQKESKNSNNEVIDLKKGKGKKKEKQLNFTNLGNLDIYYSKYIDEMTEQEQRQAMYTALKRVGVHDGPANKIINAVIEQDLDYKTVIIEKTDILIGRYKNLAEKNTSLAGYITSTLYNKLSIEKSKN